MAKLVSTRRVADDRYGVSPRSIDRWVDDEKLGFPRPIKINNRNYFDEAELDEFDRRRAAARNAGTELKQAAE